MSIDMSVGRAAVVRCAAVASVTTLIWLHAAWHMIGTTTYASDAVSTAFVPQSIPIVDSGVEVGAENDDTRWNRLVLLAQPKINSGDVDAISDTVRDAATKCALTIMATVKKSASSDQQGAEFQLLEIGVGYSAGGASGTKIIRSDTADGLGVSLGFIGRQVLKSNERQLDDVTLIAKTKTFAVFDAPSVMHRGGAHRKYLTRHFVYIVPRTGGGMLMTWLLVPPSDDTKADDKLSIINQPIRVTKWGTVETRRIHVDGDQFSFLGIPGELAFALEDLPPGSDLRWNRRAAKVAGLRVFEQQDLDELSAALGELIQKQ